MKREENNMPAEERAPVVVGTTFTAAIYDKIVAYGKMSGLKDNEVIRLAVAKLVSHI